VPPVLPGQQAPVPTERREPVPTGQAQRERGLPEQASPQPVPKGLPGPDAPEQQQVLPGQQVPRQGTSRCSAEPRGLPPSNWRS